jgi:hypothetical protein
VIRQRRRSDVCLCGTFVHCVHRPPRPFKNWRQLNHKNLCFREYKLWRQRHILNLGSRRMHLRNLIHQGWPPAEYGSRHLHLQKKTLLLHYRIPRTGRHAASGRMIGYGLENQSRRRNGARLSATILILTGIGSSKALCNVRSAASTMRARICLRDSMRSAHCLSTRRWTLNGYIAVIRATPLTPLRENKSSGDLR